MSDANSQVVINTKEKTRMLEEIYEEARLDPEEDEHLREVELESLKRLINQLKEEIVRYEAHQPTLQ
jgi:hypothetical protein